MNDLIRLYARHWNIRNLTLQTQSGPNYIAKGFQGEKHIVLKTSANARSLAQEARALRAFEGYGTVQLLAQEAHALLLQCADPGQSLCSLFPEKDHASILITAACMKQLHTAPLDPHFKTLADRVAILAHEWAVPEHLLKKARMLTKELLDTTPPAVMLHGDLHHSNIVRNNDAWLVIDPKGLIGDPTYEAAAFIVNPKPQLIREPMIEKILVDRIELFAQKLHCEKARIASWAYVHTILAWIWALEDGQNYTYWKEVAPRLNFLIR
ncbi:MAG: streptomycin 6-kinase [Candidatus Dependentiae bacterium]|nr:streptomycin 6-kinase [Candidatus Dependentiae bacterium]